MTAGATDALMEIQVLPPLRPVLLPEPSPDIDGPLLDLTFGRLTASILWLVESVKGLQGNFAEVIARFTRSEAFLHLLKDRFKELEKDLFQKLADMEEYVDGLPKEIPPPPPPPPPPEPPKPMTPPQSPRASERLTAEHLGGKADKSFSVESRRRIEALERLVAEQGKQLNERDDDLQEQISFFEDRLKTIREDILMCVRAETYNADKAVTDASIAELQKQRTQDRGLLDQTLGSVKSIDGRVGKLESDVEDLQKTCDEHDLKLKDQDSRLRMQGLRLDTIEEAVERHELLMQEQEEQRKARKAANKAGALDSLGEVDIQTEVRRLRGCVEVLEQKARGDEDKFGDFLKGQESKSRGGNPRANARAEPLQSTIGSTTTNAGQVTRDLVAFEERLVQAEENVAQDQKNTMRVVSKHEKELEMLNAKIEDLWNRIPRMITVLEALDQTTGVPMVPPPPAMPASPPAPRTSPPRSPVSPSRVTFGDSGEAEQKQLPRRQEGQVPRQQDVAGGNEARPGEPEAEPGRTAVEAQCGEGDARVDETVRPFAETGGGTETRTGDAGKQPPEIGRTASGGNGTRGMAKQRSSPALGRQGSTSTLNQTKQASPLSPIVKPPKNGTGAKALDAHGAGFFSGSSEGAMLTGLVRQALQVNLDELRDFVERSYAKLQKEKANVEDLDALSSRLDAWTQHAPGCAQGLRNWRDSQEEKPASPVTFGTPDYSKVKSKFMHATEKGRDLDPKGCNHAKCKEPTCPRSLGTTGYSLGRLPILSLDRGRV